MTAVADALRSPITVVSFLSEAIFRRAHYGGRGV